MYPTLTFKPLNYRLYVKKEIEDMIHMQEEEFEKIEKSTEKCPPHEVVKLYYMGTHSDYGCIKCKRKSLILADFEDKS